MPELRLPEDSEIVLCTVTKIYPTSVFVTLDEYDAISGMIHISEISPGRIRNIREFVEEGKRIVCKILRIDKQKGHIDLSLRRVSEQQRREKADELKQHQRAKQIVDYVAKQTKTDGKKMLADIEKAVLEEYPTVFSYFEDVSKDNTLIKSCKLEPALETAILEVIVQRIKPPQVEIKAQIAIKTYVPDGVEVIKKILADIKKIDSTMDISYLGGGRYHLTIIDEEYKSAEKKLEKTTDFLTESFKKTGEVSVTRQE